jgi:hypothetical protein
MITTWRWDRDDQLPNGCQLGLDWLGQIRAALDQQRRSRSAAAFGRPGL